MAARMVPALEEIELLIMLPGSYRDKVRPADGAGRIPFSVVAIRKQSALHRHADSRAHQRRLQTHAVILAAHGRPRGDAEDTQSD